MRTRGRNGLPGRSEHIGCRERQHARERFDDRIPRGDLGAAARAPALSQRNPMTGGCGERRSRGRSRHRDGGHHRSNRLPSAISAGGVNGCVFSSSCARHARSIMIGMR